MNKEAKIYIAGHKGLVGSAILRQLQAKGYTNFCFTPHSQIDLTRQSEVEAFFEREKPNYVVLAAAKVGGIWANNVYRADFIYENLQIQNNIIHSAYKNNVEKLLFLGSSCIYPKNAPQPMQENYLLTDILEYTNEPYAIAKIAGIKLIESYNLQYGTNYIAVMPTNLYGPHDNFNLEKSHVLPALIRKMHLGKMLQQDNEQALRNDLTKNPIEEISGQSDWNDIVTILSKYGITKNSITLWGTGSPKREFLHADDLASACVYLMENIDFRDIVESELQVQITEHPFVGADVRNTHINIGTGKDISIKELAAMIKEITGYEGQIEWDRSKPDGTFQKLLNVTTLEKLGWKAQIHFREGIEAVYKNYCA
jgi:GDP-L-fucose synthase